MQSSRVPNVLKLVYFHNPFYLISAGLFVYGLKLLFRPDSSDVLFQVGSVGYIPPWSLLLSLTGVTLLMAATAVAIVRLGKVWEDARSLMLIVLLMFLAISVSFDEIVTLLSVAATSSLTTIVLCVLQTTMLLIVAEFMLRGMRICLSWRYRGPMYLMLILFLTFPLLLLPGVSGVTNGEARWLIAAFPTIAALITLLLLPAVWRGSKACEGNGTPWSWPWFPWTAFGFLAAAVCFRSWSLTISFDVPSHEGHFWDTSFGLYFLVPFALAVLVILLEIGVVEKMPKLQTGTMLAAPLLIAVAYPWLVPWMRLGTYAAFANEFVTTAGSPVFLTICGLIAFYGWAWFRGVRHGEIGVAAMLLLSVFIGPRAFGPRTWSLDQTQLQLLPLLVLGGMQLLLGVWRRGSRETLVGLLALALAGGLFAEQTPMRQFQSTILYHLVLLAILIVGAAFGDVLARRLRLLGGVMISAAIIGAVIAVLQRGSEPVWNVGYVTCMVAFVLGYGVLLKERIFVWLALCHMGLGAVGLLSWCVREFLLMPLPSGVRPVVFAAASFAVAVVISCLKAGMWRGRGTDAVKRTSA